MAATLVALAVAPAAAQAADRYVDAETGADTDPECTLAGPCETIGYAIANADTGDRVLVDSGSYAEGVTLANELALEFEDFVPGDGNAPAVLDGGASAAITVAASGAGRIGDLVIRSDAGEQVIINGQAEVDSNTFDDPDAGGTVVSVRVNSGGGGSAIHDNTFIDPAPDSTRARIGIYAPLSTPISIRDNVFNALNLGVQVGNPGAGNTTTIASNLITQIHNLPFSPRGILVSGGGAGDVILEENEISAAATSGVNGIDAHTNVSLIRNRISGVQNGVFLGTDMTGVTLEGDRIWGNTGYGIRIFDSGGTPPKSSLSATNVTIVENGGADIFIDGGSLTLDSSIVEDTGWSLDADCTITYSRADATGADASGCNGFQTTADPMLLDAAGGDLSLLAGSPMIDQGNPADPGPGAVDFDGDPRALDATPACTGNVDRRDIGADEFVPAPIDCEPPETTIETGPADGALINVRDPSFTFSSTEVGSTFQCSIDDAPFVPTSCSNDGQHNLLPLDDGQHSFAVRAVDSAGNPDASPPSRTFTVDTGAPETEITRGPRARTTNRVARLAWRGEDASAITFRCSLDAKPFRACATSRIYRRLARGRHRFRVRATDAAGNVEAAPAVRRWRIVKRR